MPTSDKQPRLYALDAMRGLCALALMLYHYLTWNGTDYFQIGYFGVYIFFILSGFSMWYVYAGKPFDAGLVKHFFVARVARIMPLYVVVCLLATCARVVDQGLDSITNVEFFHRFILNVTMLFGFAMPGKASIVPGGWSIGIEWVFYLAFPLSLLFLRRMKAVVALLAAAYVINQVIVYALLGDSTMGVQWNYYTVFPTFLMYFLAGQFIAMAHIYLQQHRAGGEALPFPDSRWLCRLVPLASLVFIFMYPSATGEDFLKGCHVSLLLLVAMGGVFFASFARPNGWEKKLYRFLGDVSYSTYLLNFFVYHAVDTVLKHVYPAHTLGMTMALAMPGSVALAYCSYRFFEMPARVWINRKLA